MTAAGMANYGALLVVECDGDTLLAYLGIKRALNAGAQLEPAPRRKRIKKHGIISTL
jgi:hypothetical protein